MEIEVKSINELKNALNSGASEIVTYDEDLVRKLKAVKLAKSWVQRPLVALLQQYL
ncbi:TPA: hypothetical protein ACVOYM_004571 [Vibrio diabolicus]|uniref:hypothetical protein n=1 Tax=Vibrio diabolicus TaxID=50719 RepID=UPI000AAB9B81|nr:hypothetical protein [Vibrio diabolicus]MCR9303945.1 hypothetical protein [Vibrio diabolicus]MCR9427769.1 hypothetical protein [Vibrio diabolicus]MCS0312603.1 hypothetical protein [Vibrio diabolicus]MCS0365747.1 hypothetical protein [Vibrio diabolicus]MCS0383857.1 hypothetical protein [Vibrio diabolicus]